MLPLIPLAGQLATKAAGSGMLSKGGSGQAPKLTQAAVSGATSLVQGIKAKKLKEKADSAMPELVDPGQAAFLSELNQKRRSIDTGADFAAGMQAIDATNAGTNEAITRSAGGDASGTIQALLQSERVAGDSKNNVLAQGQQQQAQYSSMYGNLLNDVSQRRLELQLMRSQQARAEWAKMQSNAAKNFQGFLGGMNKQSQQSMPTDNGLQKISNIIPKLPTPTPESAGIPNETTMMNGKAEMPPMVSGNSIVSNGLPELTMKK